MSENVDAPGTGQAPPPRAPQAPETPETAAGSADQPKRRIDARSLRALAHPLRVQIMDILRLDGPSTATGLAKRLGESTGTTSWHLRHLAEHGFIEEDTERGNRRERWWRHGDASLVMAPSDFVDDPASRGSMFTFLNETIDLYYRRLATFVAEVDTWDAEWLQASTASDWNNLRLTPERLKALNEELFAVIDRYNETKDPDGETVVVQVQAFPRHQRTER